MTPRHEPPVRRVSPEKTAVALKLAVSAAVGVIFLLALVLTAYVEFPRRIAAFKDGGQPSRSFQREFSIDEREPGNTWTLEAVFPRSPGGGQVFEALLNGASIGRATPRGRSFLLEFPGARLNPGFNTLDVLSNGAWTFRRLRVKNFTGYSSGFPTAVLFHRDNRYPEARRLPRGAAASAGLALLFVLSAVANGAAELKPGSGRRVSGVLKKLRYLIPAMFIPALILPVVSRFRVWFEWRSLLALVAVFFGLAFLPELTGLGKRVWRQLAAAAATLVRVAGRPAARTLARLKPGDRLSVLLLVALSFVCLVRPGPVVRSGDGLEYAAMLVSWAESGRPYVTSDSAKLMELRLGQTPGPGEDAFFADLKARFPALLRNGTEMDLPHFWFYSLAASVFYYPVRLFSLNIGLAFMLLHVLLVAGGFLIVRRALGPAAGLSLLLLVFFSPLIWFVNKVHVELFTVVLASVGAALLAAENWAGSALSFALASTQNPPFAILAGLAFGLGFLRKKWALVRGRLPVWLGVLALAALQPAYYLSRLGILNPVVATGAADLSRDAFSLRKMFSVLVDPDIGLLANWPVALLLLLVFAWQAGRRRVRLSRQTWIFVLASLPVLLWSQSRTLNLNHGGTYLVSRYAVWYIFVFFLVLWQLLLSLAKSSGSRRRVWGAVGLLAGVVVLVQFWPARREEYLRPTAASRWLYDYWPGLYNPMPEIFTERYRRVEENLPESVWAVSNFSGNKILVRRGRMMNLRREEDLVPLPACPDLDLLQVYKEAKRRFDASPSKKYIYINGQGRRLRRAPTSAAQGNPAPREANAR
jgi:hypothetical protein